MNSLPAQLIDPETPLARHPSVATLFIAYILMMAGAFFVLRQGFSMTRGAEINVDRAIFMVINTATLSGFQLSVTPNEYKLPGQITMLVLTIGGSLFTMIVGSSAVARIVRLPYSFRQIVIAAVVAQAAALLLGTLLLAREEVNLLSAMMQAAGAFGNSGVHIGRLPGVMDWRTHIALLPLAIAGGLGLVVLMNGIDWLRGRGTLVTHTRVVITMSAALYLAGMGLILVIEWLALPDSARTSETAMLSIASASTASINSRTLGMPFGWSASLARAAQWVVMLLMMIGASPGGTGGGLKTTTIAALFSGARRVLNGKPPGRAMGIALVWVGLYLLVAGAALLVLLETQVELETDRLLFLCISAASNVGLSHDTVTVVGGGLYTLSFLMLFGRLAPLMILWWMATTTTDADMAIG